MYKQTGGNVACKIAFIKPPANRHTSLHLPSVCAAAEEAAPEEDEDEENPFATEFQEDQEAAYLKDPKKALQGFYDREGEIKSQGSGVWDLPKGMWV